ncbi:MAG: TIGR04086 family membrane protein [Planctomycetota bacterium]
MNQSLLEKWERSLDTQKTIRASSPSAPSWSQRVGQCLAGVLWAHFVILMLILGLTVAAITSADKPAPIQQSHPTLLSIAFFCIPLLGAAAGTMVATRMVYLAQLVGIAIGVVTSLAFLGERAAFGFAPAWFEWLILPPLGAVLGFISGLRVGGPLIVQQTVEYKPIDSWDREAQPNIKEMNPRVMMRWNRLLWGIGVGLASSYGIRFLLGMILRPLYRFNDANVQIVLTNADLGIRAAALLLGGIVAGASTKSGKAQGFLTGLAIFFLRFYFTPPRSNEDLLLDLAICLVAATIGGMIGRKVFHPTHVYHSPTER